MAAMWRHFMAFDPRLSISALEGTTSELIGHLRAGALDCAICRFSHDELGDDIVQELLYQQQAHLVVANVSAKTIVKDSGLDIASLSAMDWIFPPPDTPTRRIIDAIFASAGRQVPTPIVEASSIRIISTAMEWMPRGVTVLPRDIALTVASSGFCEMLDEPLPWRMPPVGLAWTTNTSKSRTVAALAATIRKEVGTV
jgi:DNA-binding transcriptional LysR family regulator